MSPLKEAKSKLRAAIAKQPSNLGDDDWSDIIAGPVRKVLDREVSAAWKRGEDGDARYDELIEWIQEQVEGGLRGKGKPLKD